MSIDVTTDLQHTVEDAAAHLYVWALKDIPQDLRDALDAARKRETSKTGIRVLETIHRNVAIADEQKNLVCQDTGIAVYYCRVGEHFPLHPARIYEGLKAGTERATVEHPLRSNTVHTLTRENTGPNVGYRVPVIGSAGLIVVPTAPDAWLNASSICHGRPGCRPITNWLQGGGGMPINAASR